MIEEDLLHKIVSAADDAIICIDSDHAITFFNEGAERIFGYQRGDIMGASLETLIPAEAAPNHKSHIDGFAESGLTSRRMTERRDVFGQRKDGTQFPAQVSIVRGAANSQAEYAAIVRDVSLERRREQSLMNLLKEHTLLETAINSSDLGVSVVDPAEPDMPLVYVSDGFERLTGYSRGEVLGKSCKFMHGSETDRKTLDLVEEAMRTRQPTSVSILNYKRDESTYWSRLVISPIHDNTNTCTAIVGIQYDITKDKLRERSLAEAQRLEALGVMAGNIAHEINNWIQPTLAAQDILAPKLTGPGHDDANAFLERLADSGKHMRQVVRSVLEFARGEKTKNALEPLNIREELCRAINFVQGSMPPSIKLHHEDMLSQTAMVIHSRTGLTQIITNLCVNAARAMGEVGQITISIIDQLMTVEEAIILNLTPGRYVCIAVADQGIGIPKNFLDKVFDPFFSKRSGGRGTGLGLSVAQGIIRSWHGQITVNDTSPRGTTFHIHLPIHTQNTDM